MAEVKVQVCFSCGSSADFPHRSGFICSGCKDEYLQNLQNLRDSYREEKAAYDEVVQEIRDHESHMAELGKKKCASKEHVGERWLPIKTHFNEEKGTRDNLASECRACNSRNGILKYERSKERKRQGKKWKPLKAQAPPGQQWCGKHKAFLDNSLFYPTKKNLCKEHSREEHSKRRQKIKDAALAKRRDTVTPGSSPPVVE